MADQPVNPGATGSIPPKAVPPTFRAPPMPAPEEGAAPAAPRTVRLKPVSLPPGGAPSAAAPKPVAAQPAAASSNSDATETIKRMTARIAVLSGEVEPAVAKKRTGQVPVDRVDPLVKKATSGLAGVISDQNPTVKRMTTRIQMPSNTGLIPELPEENGPRTIKLKPIGQGGTQPIVPVEMASIDKGAVKAGTSRIPLESAMAVPPTEAPAAAAGDGSMPKTIKLKRPGEMATVKVSVVGAKGATESAPALASATAAPASADTDGSKKTIRVKRPSVPAVSAGAAGEGSDEEAGIGAPALEPAHFVPAAPERGTGWFIALAAVGMIVIIGLGCLLAVQLYGGQPHTELDKSYQTN